MTKPLAILLPGLDGTGRFYAPQIEALSGRYRVQPWQYGPDKSVELSDLVREVSAAIRNERPGSVLVVAESFGGLVGLQLVLDDPEPIERLCLINAFPYYRRRVRIRLGCRLSGLLELPVARQVKDLVVQRTLRSEGITPENVQLFREAIRHVQYPAYCRRLELVRDIDLRHRLSEVRVPVHLFASGRDKLVPSIAEARSMHSIIPDSKLYEFPHAGHALLLTSGFILADYLP